jgi:hypothetical protein
MMMQMLYNGGVEVICKPGNELISGECEDALEALKIIASNKAFGKAVKCLDPHRFILPPDIDYRVIWMRRDYTQQASSIRKFMRGFLGINVHKSAIKKIAKDLITDTKKCLKLFSSKRHIILEVSFEDVLSKPDEISIQIKEFISDIVDLDHSKMESTVLRRDSNCYNGFLEVEIIRKATEK